MDWDVLSLNILFDITNRRYAGCKTVEVRYAQHLKKNRTMI